MAGKPSAQPSGDPHGKAVANRDASGDVAAAQGGASRQRQALGLSMDGAAGSAEGPSEVTLQRALSFLLERTELEPEGAALCFQVNQLDAPLPSLPLTTRPAHGLCWLG